MKAMKTASHSRFTIKAKFKNFLLLKNIPIQAKSFGSLVFILVTSCQLKRFTHIECNTAVHETGGQEDLNIYAIHDGAENSGSLK